MNERIRELADSAKEYAITRLDDTGELHKYYDVYFEKFAELIVRECANIATINAHQWASPGTYVLKHFGVEE